MKRLIFLFFRFFFLQPGFVFLDAFVLLTEGDKWFVTRKLKIGALILTLSGIIACNSPKPKDNPVTCYTPKLIENNNDSSAMIQKKYDDSIASEKEKNRINDSVKKSNHKKIKKKIIDPLKPTCYSQQRLNNTN